VRDVGRIHAPDEHPGGRSGGELEIRRYREPDHDAVWDLHNVALHAVGAHAGNGPFDDDLHHVIDVYERDRGEFLVGLLGGRIVAMGALRRRGPDTAEITRMRVLPGMQRRGFGRIILRHLEARARELGYRRLVLKTTERQTAALGLYRAEGFVETGRDVVAGMPCVDFAKPLVGVA